jgi:hypothetical protein
MYPKMWEASGVPPKQLVTRLIELAIERRRERRALKTEIYRKVRGLPRSRRRYVKQQW